MSGEKDLNKMLRHMEPRLNEDEYVFCTLSPEGPLSQGDTQVPGKK